MEESPCKSQVSQSELFGGSWFPGGGGGGACNEAMTRIYPHPGMYFIRRLSRDSLSLSGSIYLGSRGARRMRKF